VYGATLAEADTAVVLKMDSNGLLTQVCFRVFGCNLEHIPTIFFFFLLFFQKVKLQLIFWYNGPDQLLHQHFWLPKHACSIVLS
jgi:hypothetical protein